MKENSIEEDIKILEEMIENANIENMDMNNCFGGEHIEAIEHILSDYKRVLKENESYQKSDYETVCLENNELREITDRIQSEYNDLLKDNFKLKNELETKRKEYQETYKDVREEIKELKKENEELKNDYENLNNSVVVKNHCIKNSIPVQKIKDIIEKEIKYHEKNILDIENITMLKGKTAKEEAEIEFNKYTIVVLKEMLQELLEGRK